MKKLSNAATKTSIDMSTSERLSQEFDEAYNGKDSISCKVKSTIGGKKLESHERLVKAATGQTMSQADGSFSFRLPNDFAIANSDALVSVVSSFHRYTDYALSKVYAQLDEADKAEGKAIAIQNLARDKVLDYKKDTALTKDQVSGAMDQMGILKIPDSSYLSFTITMGTQFFSEPVNKKGFKEQVDTSVKGGRKVWRKTSECFGRKRVPIKTEAADTLAIDAIFKAAKMWEDMMKDANGGNAEELFKLVQNFSTALVKDVPEDYKIVTNSLSTADEEEAIALAKEIIDFIERG